MLRVLSSLSPSFFRLSTVSSSLLSSLDPVGPVGSSIRVLLDLEEDRNERIQGKWYSGKERGSERFNDRNNEKNNENIGSTS